MSDAVQKLLAMDTWAIVGLSNDTTRAAYGVAKFLQDKGKRIVPVHPSAPVVHGEQGYTTLTEIPFEVDVVDCFVRSELDDAIREQAKGVWLQLGVIDHAAARRAHDAGLLVVMDRCPKIDWYGYGPA
jgi:predicted CoA-binding protein